MLSSILNLPRRRKSGPSSPAPVTSQETNREEDGFVLVGESASERNTIMPTAASNVAVPPPPSYAQVTSTPQSLPSAAAGPGYHGYTSPSTSSAPASSIQINHLQQTDYNRTNTGNTVSQGLCTSPNLNKSGNSNWGVIDVPFQLSGQLCQSDGTRPDYFVPQLPEVDWGRYNYDFQFEERVKQESEMALEKMEELD